MIYEYNSFAFLPLLYCTVRPLLNAASFLKIISHAYTHTLRTTRNCDFKCNKRSRNSRNVSEAARKPKVDARRTGQCDGQEDYATHQPHISPTHTHMTTSQVMGILDEAPKPHVTQWRQSGWASYQRPTRNKGHIMHDGVRIWCMRVCCCMRKHFCAMCLMGLWPNNYRATVYVVLLRFFFLRHTHILWVACMRFYAVGMCGQAAWGPFYTNTHITANILCTYAVPNKCVFELVCDANLPQVLICVYVWFLFRERQVCGYF